MQSKFANLSKEAKLVFYHLNACPQTNAIGFFFYRVEYLAIDLKLELIEIKKVLNELEEGGFLKWDEKNNIIYLRGFLKLNPVTNPNQLKNALKLLQELQTNEIPEAFWAEFLEATAHLKNCYKSVLKGFSKEFIEALPQAFTQSSRKHRIQETEERKKNIEEKENRIKEEKEENKSSDSPQKDGKKKFLDFVYLTSEEFQKLVEKFGEGQTRIWIEKLNNYLGSKGKKYKSHYHTILNWERMENERRMKNEAGRYKPPEYFKEF